MPRARVYFGPWTVYPDSEMLDATACIEALIDRLCASYLMPGGWRSINHSPKKDQSFLTDTNIHWVQVICRYIVAALEVAPETMPGDTRHVCCKIALEKYDKTDVLVAVNRPKTIVEWH